MISLSNVIMIYDDGIDIQEEPYNGYIRRHSFTFRPIQTDETLEERLDAMTIRIKCTLFDLAGALKIEEKKFDMSVYYKSEVLPFQTLNFADVTRKRKLQFESLDKITCNKLMDAVYSLSKGYPDTNRMKFMVMIK